MTMHVISEVMGEIFNTIAPSKYTPLPNHIFQWV